MEAFDLRKQIPLNGIMPHIADEEYYEFLENLPSEKKESRSNF